MGIVRTKKRLSNSRLNGEISKQMTGKTKLGEFSSLIIFISKRLRVKNKASNKYHFFCITLWTCEGNIKTEFPNK